MIVLGRQARGSTSKIRLRISGVIVFKAFADALEAKLEPEAVAKTEEESKVGGIRLVPISDSTDT